MKHLHAKIKKHWAKIYINAENKLLVRDQLIATFPERYSSKNKRKCEVAHLVLKAWSIKYNDSIMKLKKADKPRGINRPYKRKGKLEDFHPHDLRLYVEILEEIINEHNVTQSEILNKMRIKKEQIKHKTQSCAVIGVTRQKMYEPHKGAI